MPLSQALLYYVPGVPLALLIIFGSVLLAMSALLITRRYVPLHKLVLHNDVAGFIYATLGTIYAVLLAFMVVVSWENFDITTRNIEREANYIGDLYRDSEAFSPEFKASVRSSLDKYVDAIVNEEWPLLAKGERSMHVQDISTGIWKLYAAYRPGNETEKIFFEESVRRLNDAGELRRQRILDAQSGIPGALWLVLITGGLVTVFYTCFFGTENFGAHLLMTSMLTAVIAFIFFTVLAFDFPFTGSVRVSPQPFVRILDSLHKPAVP